MALDPVVIHPAPHPYSHPLIDWGSAIAGTLVAIAIGFVLLLLGAAIGATAMNPWQGVSEQAPTWSIGGGLWVIFSNLVALQVGAFVAVRAARWPDHHSGMLQGLVVWAPRIFGRRSRAGLWRHQRDQRGLARAGRKRCCRCSPGRHWRSNEFRPATHPS